MGLTFGELTIRLAQGELRQTNFVDEQDKSAIKEDMRSTIARYTDLGLGELFSKFILSEKELLLRTIRGYAYYYLRPEFAWSNPAVVPRKYIDDTILPKFTGDVIKILKIMEYGKIELEFDDEDSPTCSVFTPSFDTLQFLPTRQGLPYSVIYQAKHPKIEVYNPSQEIRLPVILEQALQLFVASKALSHMNGQEHSLKGQEYMAAYQSILLEAEAKDLATTSTLRDGQKLHMRGFP